MPYSEAISNIQSNVYKGGELGESQAGLLSNAAGVSYIMGGASGMAGALAQIYGAGINYQTLKTNLLALKTQASNIELQAAQRANQLREQFLVNSGAYIMGAAQRGVSVGSGSVRENLESSAMNLGQDIQTATQNAASQARALRSQYKVSKLMGKSQRDMSYVMGGINLGISAGKTLIGLGSVGGA